MLADELIGIGPLNVPVWLLAVIGGIALAAVLQRVFWRAHRETWTATNDALMSGVLVAIVVWKLTPLVTRFSEVAELPSRLIYYPGGTPGLMAGLAAGVAIAAIVIVRKRVVVSRQVVVQLGLPLALAAVGFVTVTVIPTERSDLAGLDGLPFLSGYELSASAEQPTVITAWATWCGPCTAQMPEIDRFHRQHGDDVRVIALNLTTTEQGREVVRAYLDDSALEIPVALDLDGSWADELQVRSTPTTIVYDPSGQERFRRTGAVNADWLTRRVLPLGR